METATIANLKNKLSAYLRKVREGETVLVLDRGRPIARIERVGEASGSDERLRRLEAAGLVRLPTEPFPRDFLWAELPQPQESVLEALLEERAEGR